MGALKVFDPATSTWVYAGTPGQRGPLGPTGPTGPSGGPVPTGGVRGDVIVKTSATDFDVEWTQRPRVAFSEMVASAQSHATVNTFVDVCGGTVDVDPDRYYHIFASVRCIQDPGATSCQAQAQVSLGTINLAGYDVWVTHDTGLWGAWSETWLNPGSVFTATPAALDIKLRIMLNVASKTIYTPRLYVLEY